MSKILTVAETGSTNDDLKARAREGAAEGLWVRAERQTRGRGRQGRGWESPPGNLHASTLVRLRESDPPPATLALVAGVALHEVVAHFLRHSRESGNPAAFAIRKDKRDPRFRGDDEGGLIVKWPNDLMLRGAKLAGILLEREGLAVILGFGVNLAHHPEDIGRPAIDLSAAGVAIAPEPFLEMLAESFGRWLTRWRLEGLAPVRAQWLAAAHPRGTALSTSEGEGLFDGLDEDGALRLRLVNGTVRTIHAGDVFLI